MNLVELDAPAAPKRTCSLPNLPSLPNFGHHSSAAIIPSRQSHRDTLMFFQQHAASTLSRGACEGFARPCLVCPLRGGRRLLAVLSSVSLLRVVRSVCHPRVVAVYLGCDTS